MRKARKKVQDLPAGFRYHDLPHYFFVTPRQLTAGFSRQQS